MPSPWWILLLLLLAFLTGAALGARRARRDAGEAWRAVADERLEAGRHREALDALRRARRSLPDAPALDVQEAFLLARLGETDAAMDRYEAAARVSTDGMAEFMAGLDLLDAGGPPDRVEAWLARAFEKSPLLSEDARTVFRPLAGRPGYDRLLEAASRRIEESETASPEGD
ncbi:MAG TPA: hypothetical protein VHH36_02590 [Candidatus Thermoplasmatota archaeon]|nr:hypothetical protein [Candidatus Thermoplasmatota archaeon]